MIEHLAGNSRETELKALIKILENDEQIKSLQSIFDFIDEILGLERQYQQLKEIVSFAPFYESYLNRIEDFAKKENSTENKKVLNYLYLSKMYAIKNNAKHFYEKDILHVLFEPTGQISIAAIIKRINEHSMKHEMEFLGANTFITDRIEPMFRRFPKKIDENVDRLAMCLVSNQSDDALNEKQRFKNALNWSIIFTKAKLISEFIASTSRQIILDVTSIQFDVSKDFELQQDLETSDSMEIELQSPNGLAASVKKLRGQLMDAQEVIREIQNTDIKSFDDPNFEYQETIQELEQGISVLIDVYGRIDSYLIIEKLKVYVSHIGSTNFERYEISNAELRNAVAELKQQIYTDLVVKSH